MKKGLYILLLCLISACNDGNDDERAILESAILESIKYNQEEITKSKNILLIQKTKINTNLAEEIQDYNLEHADQTEWKELIHELIQESSIKADSVVYPEIKIDNVNIKFEYHLLDSTNIFGGIEFSRIAFNEDKDMAVIFVNYGCGVECGFRSLFLFKKEDEWDYKGEIGFGIS
ncbi:hypothetical protein [Catalinimonas alkaloidigena]|uniref:hypothetical protein n=1 Tax=Catalinimonas alkaloidigena TaxID=1075417 RepID=UPI0024060BFF|nr:hypothetical protein [Catalinimonas alkaloidigena]